MFRYGVDAPPWPELAVTWYCLTQGWWIPAVVLLAGTAYCVLSGGSYTYTTLFGKRAVWRDELAGLRLAGGERVLDLGCGRGMVLMPAARRLTGGRAVGIDLWRAQDQSGNTRERTAAEGGTDRVELSDGDMRELPFDDGEFDLVVSSMAVHDIPGAEGRARAIAEAYRMLAPGGRLRVADFQHSAEYADLGAVDVTVRGLGPRFWYGGPCMVTATKPR